MNQRKRIRLSVPEFLALGKEVAGTAVKIVGKYNIAKGRITKAEKSTMIESDVSTLELDDGRMYAKVGYLGDVYEGKKNKLERILRDADAIAALATAGTELEGRMTYLRREDGTGMLVRQSLQRGTPPVNDPKRFLRLAALARLAPQAVGKGDEYRIADTRPSNIGRYGAYDIYIGRKRREKQLQQIHTHIDTEEYVERFGDAGIRALVEVLREVDEQKYGNIQRLESKGTMGNRKIVAKALATALREYPKTEKFWKELAADLRELLAEARKYYPSTKTLENVERQISYLERRKDPHHVKAWYASEIMKNLLSMWKMRAKRKGMVKSLREEPLQRRAGPSRRP